MAKQTWAKHVQLNPAFYGALIFGRSQGKVTPTRVIEMVLAAKATGDWATKTVRGSASSGVFVRFGEQADFDAMRLLFNGKPGSSQVDFKGAIDTFDGIIS